MSEHNAGTYTIVSLQRYLHMFTHQPLHPSRCGEEPIGHNTSARKAIRVYCITGTPIGVPVLRYHAAPSAPNAARPSARMKSHNHDCMYPPSGVQPVGGRVTNQCRALPAVDT